MFLSSINLHEGLKRLLGRINLVISPHPVQLVIVILQPGTNPYIKIKSVGAGKWLQRLLFISPDDVIEPESDECFLLKDRERKGCQGIEFTENVSLVPVDCDSKQILSCRLQVIVSDLR